MTKWLDITIDGEEGEKWEAEIGDGNPLPVILNRSPYRMRVNIKTDQQADFMNEKEINCTSECGVKFKMRLTL